MPFFQRLPKSWRKNAQKQQLFKLKYPDMNKVLIKLAKLSTFMFSCYMKGNERSKAMRHQLADFVQLADATEYD